MELPGRCSGSTTPPYREVTRHQSRPHVLPSGLNSRVSDHDTTVAPKLPRQPQRVKTSVRVVPSQWKAIVGAFDARSIVANDRVSSLLMISSQSETSPLNGNETRKIQSVCQRRVDSVFPNRAEQPLAPATRRQLTTCIKVCCHSEETDAAKNELCRRNLAWLEQRIVRPPCRRWVLSKKPSEQVRPFLATSIREK